MWRDPAKGSRRGLLIARPAGLGQRLGRHLHTGRLGQMRQEFDERGDAAGQVVKLPGVRDGALHRPHASGDEPDEQRHTDASGQRRDRSRHERVTDLQPQTCRRMTSRDLTVGCKPGLLGTTRQIGEVVVEGAGGVVGLEPHVASRGLGGEQCVQDVDLGAVFKVAGEVTQRVAAVERAQ